MFISWLDGRWSVSQERLLQGAAQLEPIMQTSLNVFPTLWTYFSYFQLPNEMLDFHSGGSESNSRTHSCMEFSTHRLKVLCILKIWLQESLVSTFASSPPSACMKLMQKTVQWPLEMLPQKYRQLQHKLCHQTLSISEIWEYSPFQTPSWEWNNFTTEDIPLFKYIKL
jgi:hypothetical protein